MIQIIFSTLDPCLDGSLQRQRRHRGGWRKRVCSGNLDHSGAQRLLSDRLGQRCGATLALTDSCTLAHLSIYDTK